MTYSQTLVRKASRWVQRGLDLLFPPRCVACSQVGVWLCDACLDAVEQLSPPICPKCGRPTARPGRCPQCLNSAIQLTGIRSVAIHDGVLRQAIHHLKYKQRRELGPVLGQMLVSYWKTAQLAADWVIPVPLHASRQRERGYNQAALLAYPLVQHTRMKLDQDHLVRRRATAPQVGLGAQERQVNVKDAFVWTGDALKGARVLLIDDVCTTAATLEASAQALRVAGAGSVWALTLARAR